jgi:periplasmic protein CpxP/Spy
MRYLFLVVGALLFSGAALADAPLKSSLGLDTNQAKQVQEIQKKYRRPFSAKRQELHREERRLRRAKIDNDSGAIAKQERITAKLQAELKEIRDNENDEIRAVLTSEQRLKFEEVLKQRDEAAGSSRDVKEN